MKNRLITLLILFTLLASLTGCTPPPPPPNNNQCSGSYNGPRPAPAPSGGCTGCASHVSCKTCCGNTGGGAACKSGCDSFWGLGARDSGEEGGVSSVSSATQEILDSIPSNVVSLFVAANLYDELVIFLEMTNFTEQGRISTAIAGHTPEQWESLTPDIASQLSVAPQLLEQTATLWGVNTSSDSNRFRIYMAWFNVMFPPPSGTKGGGGGGQYQTHLPGYSFEDAIR